MADKRIVLVSLSKKRKKNPKNWCYINTTTTKRKNLPSRFTVVSLLLFLSFSFASAAAPRFRRVYIDLQIEKGEKEEKIGCWLVIIGKETNKSRLVSLFLSLSLSLSLSLFSFQKKDHPFCSFLRAPALRSFSWSSPERYRGTIPGPS